MGKENSIISNLFWKFAESISAQLVTTIVSIILARLLEPSDYGLISMVIVFITLANVFVSDGLASGLIQKKDADILDFSSFLYFNIAISVVLYIILFFTAPLIADFYGEGYELIVPILRVLSLQVILTSISSVQNAYISKKMIFNKLFKSTFAGTIVSAIVGISMAYKGFGVWSLVAQYIASTLVSTFALSIVIRKLPALKFSYKRVRNLLRYSVRILGSGLLITGFQELRALIIGRIYSSEDLAFYDKGRQFPNLIITNIHTTISTVLFPKLSNEQDQILRVKNTTRNAIRFSSFLLCPMMLGLAVVSRQVVILLLTEKWLDCVPLMQLFCVINLTLPIHSANMQAIKAMGKSDTYFRLELIKKIVELVVLLITMRISVKAIVAGAAILSTFFIFVNAYPNIRLINYSLEEQLRDLFPSVISSLIMAVIVMFIGMLPMEEFPMLVIQIVVGITVYILIGIITKNKELKYIYSLTKDWLSKLTQEG